MRKTILLIELGLDSNTLLTQSPIIGLDDRGVLNLVSRLLEATFQNILLTNLYIGIDQ